MESAPIRPENDRTALLDVNGTIYTSFCHMTDSGTYHGWLIGYKYTTGSGFTQDGVWCDTCANGGNEGGIWSEATASFMTGRTSTSKRATARLVTGITR